MSSVLKLRISGTFSLLHYDGLKKFAVSWIRLLYCVLDRAPGNPRECLFHQNRQAAVKGYCFSLQPFHVSGEYYQWNLIQHGLVYPLLVRCTTGVLKGGFGMPAKNLSTLNS